MAAQSKQSTALTSPGYLVPFITVTALFFIFGFITNLNMALVPHLRKIFTLPYAWAMLAESAFFLAYLVFSWPTSKLIELIGYKKTMVVSLFIQVVGCLLFVPAAKMVSFPLFLTAVFVVGAGVTALQTSANPYVSILGPEGTSSIRLNLAQAFNSIGGTIAPIVAGAYILDRSRPGCEPVGRGRNGAIALHPDCRGAAAAGTGVGVYAPAAHRVRRRSSGLGRKATRF